MNSNDVNSLLLPLVDDFDKTIHSQRILVHRDLIPLREIRIKIVLTGEEAGRGNSTAGGQSQFDRKFDNLPIHHR